MFGCNLFPEGGYTTREPIQYNENFRTSYRDMLARESAEQRVRDDGSWP